MYSTQSNDRAKKNGSTQCETNNAKCSKASELFSRSPRMTDQRMQLSGTFGEYIQQKTAVQPSKHEKIRQNKTGLPDNLKSGVESLSGISMDNVRVHYNFAKPAQLSALAYTQGTDIHVAPGQEKHLPHEAWHVVQQAQGRVQPTMQMKNGVPVNDDKGLEHEADVMGAKAPKYRTSSGNVTSHSFAESHEAQTKIGVNPVQRYIMIGDARVIEHERLKSQISFNPDPMEASVIPFEFLPICELLAGQKFEHKEPEDDRKSFDKAHGQWQVEKNSDSDMEDKWYSSQHYRDLCAMLAIESLEHVKRVYQKTDLFDAKTGKPNDHKFALLHPKEAELGVTAALDFLEIAKFGEMKQDGKPNEIVSYKDVKKRLSTWLGVPPKGASSSGYMKGDVFGPATGDDQYDARAKDQIQAEMRYYTTFEELAWALVQDLGLQIPSSVKQGDSGYDEVAVANYVFNQSWINAALGEALRKVLENAREQFDKEKTREKHTEMDYKLFHNATSWTDFQSKAQSSVEKKVVDADDIWQRITMLHDLKSLLAINKDPIVKDKPDAFEVRGQKRATKQGEPDREYVFKISKDTMRYNLGTVDEADPWTLFMRERGRQLWAAPSFTTQQMLYILQQSGGDAKELIAEAYAIFAFWCIRYPHTATPIHTFHEVMAAAQAFGVPYDLELSVASNACKAIGYDKNPLATLVISQDNGLT